MSEPKPYLPPGMSRVNWKWLTNFFPSSEAMVTRPMSSASSSPTACAANESSTPIPRESRDIYFARIALLVATRATCARRSVGCVLTSERGHVLATGYNGVPRGFRHCTEHPCGGHLGRSGGDLDKCLATHAEQNALLQCPDVEKIAVCYTTTSPCIHCVKLLLNTGCRRIVFIEEYPHNESKELWLSAHPEAGSWLKVTI